MIQPPTEVVSDHMQFIIYLKLYLPINRHTRIRGKSNYTENKSKYCMSQVFFIFIVILR